MEVREYLPRGWKVDVQREGLILFAPDGELAQEFYVGAKKLLTQSASELKAVIHIAWDGCKTPLSIGSKSKEKSASMSTSTGGVDNEGFNQSDRSVDSYGADRISVSASYEAIEDFVRGQRAGGKIVTIMSMNDRNPAKNDLFLKVNDLQIQHRAGGWKMNDWVGSDAKSTVWCRSFDGTLPRSEGREAGWNYYQELVRRIKAGETFISSFQYLIDRPQNAGLWLDLTDYHFVQDYGGTAIRIAVSDPKNSTLIESYQN